MTLPTRRWLPLLTLLLLLGAVAAVRFWNLADVLVAGQVFFLDPDCYSRMTRVAAVLDEPGTVLTRHLFENWPHGTIPHTTAPLDYLLAAFALLLRTFGVAAPLNWAGALMPVLLAVGAAAALWRLLPPGRGRILALVLFTVSPMLVHGTVLGRPDHQSLLIALLTVALGSEALLLGRTSGKWSLANGAAWGMALWVSLYEPLILLIASLLLAGALSGRRLWSRERLRGWGVMLAIVALALAVEGWRTPLPEEEVARAFPYWAQTIGELAPAPWLALLQWSLALLFLSPLLLWLAAQRVGEAPQRSAIYFRLGLLLFTAGLTLWQARWGYFFSLAFVLSLPDQLSGLSALLSGRERVALMVILLAGWPVAQEWEHRLGPEEETRRVEERRDNLSLLDVAIRLRVLAAQQPGGEPLPVVAPWWFSPALAYWSGQPCVAGSSHQSLPGIVATARFYTEEDPAAALDLLRERQVRAIVLYDPQRVLTTSAAILGRPPISEEGPFPLGATLFTRPHSSPPGFEAFYRNAGFVVMLVK